MGIDQSALPMRLRTMGETVLRVLLATAVYVLIVILAAPFPSGAGLFLTFPALNGLAFFYSPRSSVESMAKSMLWMPVINGGLCSAFIVLFLAFSHAVAPTVLAWTLLVFVVVLWLGICSRGFVREGINHQRTYGIIVLLAGCVLVALAPRALCWLAIAEGPGSSTPSSIPLDFLPDILWHSKLKIALFALCLLLFLMLTPRLPPRVGGILGGLPIVPFGGLVSVAGDAGIDRMHILERMGTSVWLGPTVAIWFIYGYSRYLNARQPGDTENPDAGVAFAMLLVAWALCFVAILGISCALAYLAQRATCSGYS
jgi:hypothetical protein